jgi:hypothetical protein
VPVATGRHSLTRRGRGKPTQLDRAATIIARSAAGLRLKILAIVASLKRCRALNGYPFDHKTSGFDLLMSSGRHP